MKTLEDMNNNQKMILELLKEAKEVEQFVVNNNEDKEYANLHVDKIFSALVQVKLFKLDKKKR